MALLGFVVFSVVALVVAGLMITQTKASAIGQAINVTGRIKFVVDWLNGNLDTEKLNGKEHSYKQYYVCYLDEVARAICNKEGLVYNDANRFLVYHEAQRLFNSGKFSDDRDLTKSKQLMVQASDTLAGQKGADDGKIDGSYLVEPSNPGPFFNSARAHFGLPPAERTSAG